MTGTLRSSTAIFAALAALLPLRAAEDAAPPSPGGSGPAVSTHSGIEPAAEAASKDGALILLVFGAEWCGPCQLLKKKTLEDPAFAGKAGPLHLVRIDVDADSESARLFRVRAVPSLFILTAELKVVSRRTGYLDTEALLRWIEEGRRRVAEGAWEGTESIERIDLPSPGTATDADWKKIVQALGAADPAVRRRAAASLAAGRDGAVSHILEGLLDPYLGVRIGSSELLRRLAPEAPSVNPWDGAEERARQAEKVRAWWEETGELPAAPPGPALSPAEARSTKEALAGIFSKDPIQRTESMSLLVQLGNAVLPPVREAIAKCVETGDQKTLWILEDVRWAIIVPDSLEKKLRVRRDLARGSSDARQSAAGRLGTGGEAALPALRELADDGDSLVRERVIHALTQLRTADALAAMAVLLGAKDSNLRMVAAQQLGKSKSRKAGPHLAQAVDDPDEVVACVAIAALEEVKAKDQGSALVRSLGDKRWRVRAAAAEALGKLKISSASGDLARLLKDPDPFVTKSALEALRGLGYKPTEEQFEELLALVRRHPDLTGSLTWIVHTGDLGASLRRAEAIYDRIEGPRRQDIFGVLESWSHPDESKDDIWKTILEKGASSEDPAIRRAIFGLLDERSIPFASEFIARLLDDADPGVRSLAASEVLRAAAFHWGVGAMNQGRSEDFNILDAYEKLLVEGAGGIKPPEEEKKAEPEKAEPKEEEPEGREKGVVARTVRRLLGLKSARERREEIVFFSERDLDPVVPRRSREEILQRGAEIREIHRRWHGILEKRLEGADLAAALAFYACGDARADLPRLEAFFAPEGPKTAERLDKGQGFGVLLKRLPWPEGREVVVRASRSLAIYPWLVAAAEHGAEGAREYLGDPGRLVGALEAAQGEDRSALVQALLQKAGPAGPLEVGWPFTGKALDALSASGSGLARAIAAAAADGRKNEILERALKDKDPWVRRASVQKILSLEPDRDRREEKLGPFVADPSLDVAAMAAYGILDGRWQDPADVDLLRYYFRYEESRWWRSSNFRSIQESEAPERAGEKPEFLKILRERFDAEETSRHPAAPTVFAALLAQYGDWSAMEKLLELWKRGPRQAAPQIFLTALQSTNDPRYLDPLRASMASASDRDDFQGILNRLQRVPGEEAQALAREVRQRMAELEEE